MPFLLTLALFLLSYRSASAISLFPYVIPPAITIWDAASPPDLPALPAGRHVFLLPIILTYTAYNYWVFRGKESADSGYH